MVKRFTKHIFITVLVVVVVVFVMGILLGKSLGTAREDQITRSIGNIELDAESFLIEQDLFKTLDKIACNLAKVRLRDLSQELATTGRALVAQDTRKELGDEFSFLKRRYHVMQIRAYLLFNKWMDRCNTSSNVILYYYGANDIHSQEQGKILDRIVTDYNVSVFAIEYNYSKEIAFLERYYNVTETPSIVVNYEYRHAGLADYGQIALDLKQKFK